MEIDFELLKSCVKLPLKADEYGLYIWDSDGEMIAQFYDRAYFELAKVTICGELRTFDGDESFDGYYLDEEFNFINKLNPDYEVGCVRGWGHLQYKYNKKKKTKKYDPEGGIKRHDNLAAYLLKCLNTPKSNI